MTDAVKLEPCPLKVDYETSPSHLRAIAGDLHRTSPRYLSDLLCKAADLIESLTANPQEGAAEGEGQGKDHE